jgi:hypothetical protein
MEFNDSTVRDFQTSKLKEECFGGDGGGSGSFGISTFDGWGMGGGSYGKSGYMLFYERRKKKPLKVVVKQEEPAAQGEGHASLDKKEPEEKCVEVDFRQAVLPEAVPNRIFAQVLQDNRKFGFENDIYSSDFFDFVLGLQKSALGMDGATEQAKDLKKRAVEVGAYVTLEILAKAFSNSCIDEHVTLLIQAMQKDPSGELPGEFLSQQYEKDGFAYLFSLLLECPDTKARQCVAGLMKYVLVSLKMKEQDYLHEAEDYEVEGDDGKKMTMQRHRALSARFVARAIELFNTKVAKNWARFDQFHELLYTFAVADVADVELPAEGQEEPQGTDAPRASTEPSRETKAARIGLEFFMQVRFVEKACDFVLGKKSPLCRANESRPDLGGTYAHPDFSNVIKLMTALITDEALLEKYPMTEVEKEMILHNDLLKTMLGSATGSKQFGQCLANMCRDNEKLSRKVTKVFLRSIEQAHLDTVKGYLKALKPFLRANDSLKRQKLEWVFGVPAVVSRKGYSDTRHKYGLELVDRINDESMTYTSPILYGASDEALIAQIIKCKGRFDV